MNVLLFAPEYRPNLSNMIRTAEFYGMETIYVYDANNLMQPPNNKVSRADMNHMARVWTAGAMDHIDIKVVTDYELFIKEYDGRIVATVISQSAVDLNELTFHNDDLLIMGPEKEGLPEEFLDLTDHQIIIPNRGVTDCLNVSVSFGVFMNEAIRQLQ